MDKILWLFCKLKNSKPYLFLLLCGVSYLTMAEEVNCDLDWYRPHPVAECSYIFEKKLLSLTEQQILEFDKKFDKLELLRMNNKLYAYEDLAYLFKSYPHPKVLFSKLQTGILLDRTFKDEDRGLVGDSIVDNLNFIALVDTENSYNIIIYMLKDKKELTQFEKNILQRSQQRSLCLKIIIDDLNSNVNKVLEMKYIDDTCYKD